jgi:hypothetical protein
LIEKGDLDATLQSAGLGVDSIRQLGTSVAINFLEIPKDVVIQINDAAIVPSVIPARTYEGQTKDVETAAIVNFLVTHEGLSADMVYAMTRAIFSNLTQLVQTHPAASGILLKDAVVAHALAGLTFDNKRTCLPLASADLFAYLAWGKEVGQKPIGIAKKRIKSEASYRGKLVPDHAHARQST